MKAATIRSAGLGLAAAGLCLGAAGCSSATPGTVSGVVNTGTYPNLNVPPPVATQSFDPSSLKAHNQALADARTGQAQQGREAAAASAAGAAEQERLRRLAASRGADTLKAIENPG